MLGVFEVSAYHFYKLIEVAIKVEANFPRSIIKHLNRVSESWEGGEGRREVVYWNMETSVCVCMGMWEWTIYAYMPMYWNMGMRICLCILNMGMRLSLCIGTWE